MHSPFLSIIIPCFNEEKTIKKLLRRLIRTPLGVNSEIIIVDDGSKIPLFPIVQDFIDRFDESIGEYNNTDDPDDLDPINVTNKSINTANIRVFSFSSNHGKGAAVRYGISKSKGQYILIQDADLEYFPEDIPILLKQIVSGKAKIVFGSRFKKFPEGMNKIHFIGNRLLTWATNILYKSNLTDMETGYKLFPRDLFNLNDPMLNVKSFELEPALTVRFLSLNIPIFEVPIKYKYRIKGRAKIHFGDGIQALLYLMKYKSPLFGTIFSPLYYVYSNFINHKIGVIFHSVKNKLGFHLHLK